MLAAAIARDFENGGDDAIDLLVCEIRINGKRNAAVIFVLGAGEIPGLMAVLALIIRMQMQRLEVHTATDALLAQLLHEMVAVDRELLEPQSQNVKMPGTARIRRLERNLKRGIGFEYERIARRDFAPRLAHGIGLCQLRDPDGRLQIAEIVFETCFLHVVIRRFAGLVALPGVASNSMQPHHAHALGSNAVASSDHPAFAGGESLGRVKAEAGEFADGADVPRFINRRKRVRRIFDHVQIVAARNLANRIHIAGLPAEMHRNHRASFWRDSPRKYLQDRDS